MRRRLITIVGLEFYAFVLAVLQAFGGVRTDEAKYLLSIPYPHPPLLRWIMSMTEPLPFQEALWRIVWATVFIQAVWLVRDIGKSLGRPARLALCGCWLLSVGVILWAGTIMIAPINAIQGLVLVWLLSRPDIVKRWTMVVGIFWLATLFSGYQGVLYLPLAVAIFWNIRRSWMDVVLYAFAPLGFLVLYTLGNPLAMASILHHGGAEAAAATIGSKLFHTTRLWIIAGSGIVSIVGTIGILLSRRWEYVATFVFVAAFIILNWFEYYSILFTPLLIAGCVTVFQRRIIRSEVFLVALIPCTILGLILYPLIVGDRTARTTMRALQERGITGTVLIHGSFGHEWQYESRMPIRRFKPEFLGDAEAVVCAQECPDLSQEWRMINDEVLPLELWVRR